MRRRELILLIGGAAIATRSARAQQPAWTPVIGFLGIGSASGFSDGLTAFRDGLRSRGFVDGQNAAIEYRSAAGDAARLPVLAAELVQARVDVIAASGGPLPALAAEDATRTFRSYHRAQRRWSRASRARAQMSPGWLSNEPRREFALSRSLRRRSVSSVTGQALAIGVD